MVNFANICKLERLVMHRRLLNDIVDIRQYLSFAATLFCNDIILGHYKIDELESIYQNHSLFFTLIKSEIDSNSMSRGSEISVPDNIRNSNISSYRDQMNYRAYFMANSSKSLVLNRNIEIQHKIMTGKLQSNR